MLRAIVVAAASAGLVGLALAAAFARIRKDVARGFVIGSYVQCDGEWHEAILNHCDLGLKRIPQQPVNTYTNLAYVAAGVLVGQLFDTGPAQVFMVSMTFLGLGSALYHGLSVRWAGHMDVLAIYWVFVGLLLYSGGRLCGTDAALTSAAMFLFGGLFASFLRLFRRDWAMNIKIGLLLGPILLLEVLYVHLNGVPQGYVPVAAALVLFAVAFGVWILDRNKLFRPRRWGHGVWHLLTAAAIPILFAVVS
jgi:hypothetical protein